MHRVLIGGVAIGKRYRPRQRAGFAITTAGHKTAQPSEGVSQRDAWREGIEGGPHGHFFHARENNDGRARANERPVKHQAGALEEQFLDWFASCICRMNQM